MVCGVRQARDDLTTGASMDFTPPVSAFTEQFSNMSVNDKQWPDLGRDGDSGSACGGHGRRRRLDDRERRTRDSPRELTWEERIRKGAVQKERVEQRGSFRYWCLATLTIPLDLLRLCAYHSKINVFEIRG
ncbi:hypothetical protein ANCCEY_09883 [Ancylostoma ceylanicum]|uniref:Uncharacterized protein n=1 Tax=Ancylostoma ceylanicum TaxID=53326 RepID=A0A0D6LGD0_9BILA|nr:hypothetical protein ANCCEY_09883 [Ancylostoma ceylanicum]